MSDYGLERGAVELQSVGPIAFGPGDVLFVGDNGAASIVAIDVGDRRGRPMPVRPTRSSSTTWTGSSPRCSAAGSTTW